MKYLVYISILYSSKNTVQQAIQTYLKSFERLLIDKSDLEKFKAQIIENIEGINSAYPRCKPVKAYWQKPYDAERYKDEYLRLGEIDASVVCHFTLKFCKEEVKV